MINIIDKLDHPGVSIRIVEGQIDDIVLALKINGKGKSIVVLQDYRAGSNFSADIALLIVNIPANRVPPLMTFLEAKPNRPHSFLKERVLLDKVDKVESHALSLLIPEGEVKPLIISFSICIILQNKIILFYLTFQTLIGVHEVAAFEPRLELAGLPAEVGLDLLIIMRIIVCRVVQRE